MNVVKILLNSWFVLISFITLALTLINVLPAFLNNSVTFLLSAAVNVAVYAAKAANLAALYSKAYIEMCITQKKCGIKNLSISENNNVNGLPVEVVEKLTYILNIIEVKISLCQKLSMRTARWETSLNIYFIY